MTLGKMFINFKAEVIVKFLMYVFCTKNHYPPCITEAIFGIPFEMNIYNRISRCLCL